MIEDDCRPAADFLRFSTEPLDSFDGDARGRSEGAPGLRQVAVEGPSGLRNGLRLARR